MLSSSITEICLLCIEVLPQFQHAQGLSPTIRWIRGNHSAKFQLITDRATSFSASLPYKLSVTFLDDYNTSWNQSIFQGNEPLVGKRPFTRIGKHSHFGSPTSDGTISDSAQKPTVSCNFTMVKREIGKKDGRKRISGNFLEIRPLNSTSEFWSNCRLYGPVSRASSPRIGASSTLRLSSWTGRAWLGFGRVQSGLVDSAYLWPLPVVSNPWRMAAACVFNIWNETRDFVYSSDGEWIIFLVMLSILVSYRTYDSACCHVAWNSKTHRVSSDAGLS